MAKKGVKQNSHSSKTWLTSSQAARQLGITTNTLYRLIDTQQIPAYRFGRCIRLKKVDVTEFVEQSRIQPTKQRRQYDTHRHH